MATVAFDYGAAREYLRNGENGAAVDSDDQFIEAAVRLAPMTRSAANWAAMPHGR